MAPAPSALAIARVRELGHEVVGLLGMASGRRPDLADALRALPTDVVVAQSRDDLAPALERWQPDVAICNGFGWRISAEVLSIPRRGIVNVHPSLLPRWRGPNPFGWTLRANDPVFGLTYHLMDADFDTGPILAQGSVPLDGTEWLHEALDKLRPLFDPLLEQALARVEAGDRGDPQPTKGATYAPLFEDDYAEIDWSRTVREVFDQCRSWFSPSASGIMGPLTTLDGERVRVLEASLDLAGPGVLVDCADGLLRVVRTEPALT